jgi:hypothetical protein
VVGKATNPHDQEEVKTLKTALYELELKYNITFFYKTDLVEGLTVGKSARFVRANNLDEDLKNLLEQHQLMHKKAGATLYVIIPKASQNSNDFNKIETKALTPSSENQLITFPENSIQNTFKLTSLHLMKVVGISGKVSDENGEGVPGVNVLVKGSTVGTTTAGDGTYSLNVPDGNSTLVFSFIGYITQEVPINNRTTINVSLVPDVQSLNEVVVVGYGTVKKSDLTGSVASIKADKLLERNVTSVGQALQGRIAGVDVAMNTAAPGKFPKVRIRGINSINSGVDPLYVVDGVVGV